MSQTVSVPVSLPVVFEVEFEPPQAVASSATAVATLNKSFRGFMVGDPL
jgi:hypothetical protein